MQCVCGWCAVCSIMCQEWSALTVLLQDQHSDLRANTHVCACVRACVYVCVSVCVCVCVCVCVLKGLCPLSPPHHPLPLSLSLSQSTHASIPVDATISSMCLHAHILVPSYGAYPTTILTTIFPPTHTHFRSSNNHTWTQIFKSNSLSVTWRRQKSIERVHALPCM